MPKIKGGYYLKARVIQEKKISKAPPHIREIWDYLLLNANHRDNVYGGNIVKRGQLFRSYQDIRDGLSWNAGWRKMTYSENHTKKAMKFLREAQMIATKKELGGVLITILNYDHYQNPKNYERTNEGTNERTIEEPLRNQPLPDTNKNVKNVKNDKNVKNKIKTFSENSDPFLLSQTLYHLILKRNLKFKKQNLQAWSRTIDLMLRVDKRTFSEIHQVIEWCQEDVFWQNNILSTAKLKKQFDQLFMKMQAESTPSKKAIMPTTYAQAQDLERRQRAKWLWEEMKRDKQKDSDKGAGKDVPLLSNDQIHD